MLAKKITYEEKFPAYIPVVISVFVLTENCYRSLFTKADGVVSEQLFL